MHKCSRMSGSPPFPQSMFGWRRTLPGFFRFTRLCNCMRFSLMHNFFAHCEINLSELLWNIFHQKFIQSSNLTRPNWCTWLGKSWKCWIKKDGEWGILIHPYNLRIAAFFSFENIALKRLDIIDAQKYRQKVQPCADHKEFIFHNLINSFLGAWPLLECVKYPCVLFKLVVANYATFLGYGLEATYVPLRMLPYGSHTHGIEFEGVLSNERGGHLSFLIDWSSWKGGVLSCLSCFDHHSCPCPLDWSRKTRFLFGCFVRSCVCTRSCRSPWWLSLFWIA